MPWFRIVQFALKLRDVCERLYCNFWRTSTVQFILQLVETLACLLHRARACHIAPLLCSTLTFQAAGYGFKKTRYPAVENFRKFLLNIPLNPSKNIRCLFGNLKRFQKLLWSWSKWNCPSLICSGIAIFRHWKYLCSETMSQLPWNPGGGGSIFPWYVVWSIWGEFIDPILVTFGHYSPILVDFVANSRPHLSHFGVNNFLVT